MEENRELIKGVLGKSSNRKAPDNLSANIMHAWKEETERPLVIAPLISKRTWFLLSASIIGLVVWILSSSQEAVTATPMSDFLKQMTSMMSFDLTLNPVVIMSIVAMAFMIFINVLIVSGRTSVNRLSIF